MNPTRILLSLISATALAVSLSFAEAAKPAAAPAGTKGKCCVAAAKEGKACAHGCCVEATKAGKNCEKCGGTNPAKH